MVDYYGPGYPGKRLMDDTGRPFQRISREWGTIAVSIAGTTAVSSEIDFTRYSGGVITMPGTITAASIGFKVSPVSGGTLYTALYDRNGNLVQIDSPVADRVYEIPPEVFPCGYVQLWSQNGSGSDTNQAESREFVVSLKG